MIKFIVLFFLYSLRAFATSDSFSLLQLCSEKLTINSSCSSWDGWKKNAAVDLYYSVTSYNFKDLKSIVLANELTSDSPPRVGNKDISPEANHNLNIALLFPLKQLKFQLLMTTPMKNIVKVKAPSPYEPYLVSLHNDEQLLKLGLTSIYSFNDWLAIHLGVTQGFRGEFQSQIVTSLNNSSTPSSIAITGDLKPFYSINTGLGVKFAPHLFSLAYRQESEFKIENNARGSSPLGSTTSVDYAFEMKGTPVYLPHIYSLNYEFSMPTYSLLFGVDYEVWSSWRGPWISMENSQGALRNSENKENFDLNNIFVPKVGTVINLTPAHEVKFAISFRPSLVDDIGNAGNTLDSDRWISGLGYRFSPDYLKENSFNWNVALQYHLFKTQEVTKSAKKEDDTNGLPIGYPGYTFKGSIFKLMTGINWNF